jgi:hypothetical protein
MFLNMLQEFGLIPREVMDTLITHRCDYTSAITSLSAENCTTMLEAAGESPKPLSIQLLLKGLPNKIRNKGESYFVEKFEKLKPIRGEFSQLKYRTRTTVAT